MYLDFYVSSGEEELEVEISQTGVQGYSAYEIAVQNGFEGTEQDWLESLKGSDGSDGTDGVTPTITIGTTTTLDAGSNATVQRTGTPTNPVFNFGIPQGIQGEQGKTGTTPEIQIGTVQTGTQSSATITGTPEEPILNLTLQKGDKGEKGDTGTSLIDFRVVQTLPTTDISESTFYLVPSLDAETENLYDEYIYINNDWEKIGSKSIDLSGKLDVSKVKNTTSTTSGDVYDVTYFNSVLSNVLTMVGDLNNLTTTEKSNLVGAINEVAGGSSSETIYLGDVEDFVSSNPLDLNTLNKGQYFISNRKNRTEIYVQLTYNNQLITKQISIETPQVYHQIILTMFSKVEDAVGYDTLFDLTYIIISSINNEISNKYKIIDFNTSTNQLVVSGRQNTFYVLTTNDSQTITGTKTFSVLPQSSVVPTNDTHLANKKYVDDSIASAITSALGGSY